MTARSSRNVVVNKYILICQIYYFFVTNELSHVCLSKHNLVFFEYGTKIRKGWGLHLHDVWKMHTLHWPCSRIDALSFITVVPSYYHFLASHSRIVWISFYLETSSLEPFSLFYDLIASYYTKGKWQWRQGHLFCFESYHFDKNFFLCFCLLFSVWSEEFS